MKTSLSRKNSCARPDPKLGLELSKIMLEVMPQYGKVAHAKTVSRMLHNISRSQIVVVKTLELCQREISVKINSF